MKVLGYKGGATGLMRANCSLSSQPTVTVWRSFCSTVRERQFKDKDPRNVMREAAAPDSE